MFEYKVPMSQDGSSLKEKPGSAAPVLGQSCVPPDPLHHRLIQAWGECISIQEVFNVSGSLNANTEETPGYSYWISVLPIGYLKRSPITAIVPY